MGSSSQDLVGALLIILKTNSSVTRLEVSKGFPAKDILCKMYQINQNRSTHQNLCESNEIRVSRLCHLEKWRQIFAANILSWFCQKRPSCNHFGQRTFWHSQASCLRALVTSHPLVLRSHWKTHCPISSRCVFGSCEQTNKQNKQQQSEKVLVSAILTALHLVSIFLSSRGVCFCNASFTGGGGGWVQNLLCYNLFWSNFLTKVIVSFHVCTNIFLSNFIPPYPWPLPCWALRQHRGFSRVKLIFLCRL